MANHVYIHGLNSSGVDNKTAQLIKSVLHEDSTMYSPSYDSSKMYDENFENLLAQIKQNVDYDEDTIVFGSSLGGVYAERLAERLLLKCVLINPVVQSEQLYRFVGTQTKFDTNEQYQFTKQIADSYDFKKKETIPVIVFASNNDEVLTDNYDNVSRVYQRRAHVIRHHLGHRLDKIFDDFAKNVRYFENVFVGY